MANDCLTHVKFCAHFVIYLISMFVPGGNVLLTLASAVSKYYWLQDSSVNVCVFTLSMFCVWHMLTFCAHASLSCRNPYMQSIIYTLSVKEPDCWSVCVYVCVCEELSMYVLLLQIVGVCGEELKAAQHWNGPGVIELLRSKPT